MRLCSLGLWLPEQPQWLLTDLRRLAAARLILAVQVARIVSVITTRINTVNPPFFRDLDVRRRIINLLLFVKLSRHGAGSDAETSSEIHRETDEARS
jgi:hypothetical protein